MLGNYVPLEQSATISCRIYPGDGLGLTGEELRARARELYDDALRLSRAGQHEEALRVFREAYSTVHEPTVVAAIAAELFTLRRWAEAEAAYRDYLRLAPNGPQLATARARIADLVAMRDAANEAMRAAAQAAMVPIAPPPLPDDMGAATVDTFVIIGVATAGVAAIGIAAWALTRKKKVAANRRRRRR